MQLQIYSFEVSSVLSKRKELFLFHLLNCLADLGFLISRSYYSAIVRMTLKSESNVKFLCIFLFLFKLELVYLEYRNDFACF